MTQARQEQLAKQDAERQRREQAAKIRDELEMMRKKLPILEAENARLTEEFGIWKNAQTAASALHAASRLHGGGLRSGAAPSAP